MSLEFFKRTYGGITHGNSTYIDHCVGVYNILKEMRCQEDVCSAGLYHSVYGTESFDTGIQLSKKIVVEQIGYAAERLVSIFCHLNDRTNVILNNLISLDEQTRYDLLCIEYANLKEQLTRKPCDELASVCNLLMNEIYLYQTTKPKYESAMVNSLPVFVFDDLLSNSDVEWINSYCVNSKYTPEHRSNQLNYENDSRFSCNLDDNDLKNTKLFPAIREIVSRTGLKLAIKNAYINHYTISTSTSKHCDSSDESTYTILVFCNKYWEQTWGGEIVFYDELSNLHSMVEFKPARILVFDSRISHKVLPLTFAARKDRYTIAIKCYVEKE